ncbi:hypothetical protein RRG08_008850 [Elysia crispata]|uniref:Rho guanine nucleotide exchange factor 6/7 coiled-coil domain-containing protein n=1 Tax=Elysia crispata TaxID=231223 RepID=A0AAE1A9K8_9GAST|nr:hypothetical protein RRG08_008850 [Elysia crispata]
MLLEPVSKSWKDTVEFTVLRLETRSPTFAHTPTFQQSWCLPLSLGLYFSSISFHWSVLLVRRDLAALESYMEPSNQRTGRLSMSWNRLVAVLNSPQILLAEEEKIFDDTEQQERTVVDTVYALQDRVKELEQEQRRLRGDLEEERRCRRKLEILVKQQFSKFVTCGNEADGVGGTAADASGIPSSQDGISSQDEHLQVFKMFCNPLLRAVFSDSHQTGVR